MRQWRCSEQRERQDETQFTTKIDGEKKLVVEIPVIFVL
jgi:hypothetical protein